MQILENMAVKKWLPWKPQSWQSCDTSVKIFPEGFKEKSPSLVVLALIVMKLYVFKFGAGLKSPAPQVIGLIGGSTVSIPYVRDSTIY